MNLLDENFPEDQLPLLKNWRLPFRRIGHDIARLGAQDAEILPLLHRLRGVTFFTLDADFYNPDWRHPAYALAWLDVRAGDAAHYVRRFLRHPRLHTRIKRMGLVARAHRGGVEFWELNRRSLQHVRWVD